MIHRVEFHIAQQDRAALVAAGLDTFEALLRGEAGEPLALESDRQVRRVTLADGQAYLKRVWGERPLRLMQSWLLGRRPQSAPMREYLMLKALHEAGLAAARPVAWGQRRVFGVPVEGFLLTEGVEGRPLDSVLLESQGAARLELLEKIGSLLGRLHAAGFFHIVRLKDVILTPDGRLVMIDREVAHPWPRRFSARRCRRGLARCSAKFIRSGQKLSPAEVLALSQAYLKEVRLLWTPSPDELYESVAGPLRQIMAQPRYAKARRVDGK